MKPPEPWSILLDPLDRRASREMVARQSFPYSSKTIFLVSQYWSVAIL